MNKFHILKYTKINIIIVMLFILSCEDIIEVHISKTIMFESNLYKINEDTPFSGMVYNNYSNGNKEYEGEYKDGKPNGTLTYWYENGNKMRYGQLKKGVPIGEWVYYNNEGKIQKVITH